MSTVSVMLQDMKADLDQGLLPVQVFNNRELYDLELRRVFTRTWVYIGHESELPNRGDYAIRYIGEDPFIFVRDSDGVLRVLFNSCRHRGSQVCRNEAGNATHFMCAYHGWTYKNNGALDAVPARTLGYRELDLAKWGLFAAPHVANYHGLVFANLDPGAVSFEASLGQYAWYLDIELLLSEGGMEVIGEPHRWQVEANWKQGAENFVGDSSHTQVVHRSALEAGITDSVTAGAPGTAYGVHVYECDGNAVSIRQLGPDKTAFWEYPEEVTRHFRPGRLTPAQFDIAKRALVHDGTVFPNFSFIHVGLTDSLERGPAGYLSFRVWQPKGPGKTEIWSWILAPKEASASYKRRAYRAGMSSFSPSGSFEQDDTAIWPGIARSAATVYAEVLGMKLNYQMGLGKMSDVAPVQDWPGPGMAVPSNAGESGLRTFHRAWYRQMTGA